MKAHQTDKELVRNRKSALHQQRNEEGQCERSIVALKRPAGARVTSSLPPSRGLPRFGGGDLNISETVVPWDLRKEVLLIPVILLSRFNLGARCRVAVWIHVVAERHPMLNIGARVAGALGYEYLAHSR